MRPLLLVVALLFLPVPTTVAKCVPNQLLKVVTVESTDATQTKITLYRLGEKYGRIELGDEVVVVSEPDLWTSNSKTMTGTHAVSSGPPTFKAPIFGDLTGDFWKQLEFGCELPFMKAVKAQTETLDGGGTRYRHSAEGVTVTLDIDAKGVPASIAIQGTARDFALKYVEYGASKENAEALFAKPQGVKFSEAR